MGKQAGDATEKIAQSGVYKSATEAATTLKEEIVEKVDQGTGENNHIDPLFGVASPAANETIGKAHALNI